MRPVSALKKYINGAIRGFAKDAILLMWDIKNLLGFHWKF